MTSQETLSHQQTILQRLEQELYLHEIQSKKVETLLLWLDRCECLEQKHEVLNYLDVLISKIIRERGAVKSRSTFEYF
jgi:hypothetical protein